MRMLNMGLKVAAGLVPRGPRTQGARKATSGSKQAAKGDAATTPEAGPDQAASPAAVAGTALAAMDAQRPSSPGDVGHTVVDLHCAVSGVQPHVQHSLVSPFSMPGVQEEAVHGDRSSGSRSRDSSTAPDTPQKHSSVTVPEVVDLAADSTSSTAADKARRVRRSKTELQLGPTAQRLTSTSPSEEQLDTSKSLDTGRSNLLTRTNTSGTFWQSLEDEDAELELRKGYQARGGCSARPWHSPTALCNRLPCQLPLPGARQPCHMRAADESCCHVSGSRQAGTLPRAGVQALEI